MCNFFSFVSDPSKPIPERFMFFDWTTRKKIIAGKLSYEADSHTSIADFYGYKGTGEDLLNKYEYNPLLDRFMVDQINNGVNDSTEAQKWIQVFDFKKIIAPLVIKPIIHPFTVTPPAITPEILALLKQWDSVWGSVWGSVWDSVGASVWDSVGGSVWGSVWDSVWDSVGARVRARVRDSVRAYFSSFFKIKYKHDFTPAIKLWEMGLVPSFDGKTWYLHGKENAEILWKGKSTDL